MKADLIRIFLTIAIGTLCIGFWQKSILAGIAFAALLTMLSEIFLAIKLVNLKG